MKLRVRFSLVVALLTIFSLTGCQTAYYATWEKLGKEKRDLLRDNVQKASEEQGEASEQFKDVLTQIKEIYGFHGGDLEDAYDKLKGEYEESEARADAVRERIDKVERIATDLFKEWQEEIQQISNPDLQAKSQNSLSDARVRYSKLHSAMQNAERRMEPVLVQMNDYVLYLKHNLNAQAIGSLGQEVSSIEVEVDGLITEMNKSIREAESFLRDFE